MRRHEYLHITQISNFTMWSVDTRSCRNVKNSRRCSISLKNSKFIDPMKTIYSQSKNHTEVCFIYSNLYFQSELAVRASWRMSIIKWFFLMKASLNWIIKYWTQVLIVVKNSLKLISLQFPLFQEQIIFVEKIFL